MKSWWGIITNQNFTPLLVVVIFGILAGRSLIFGSGYFNMHDDLQMMRQLQMEKCFLDFQIPCRWVRDMGYGFGFPLFNFYPPLPYLIGEIFRLFGFSFVTVVKLTFALSFIASGVGMYLLSKEFFGKIGGVLSSIFYIWAPYHAVDVYVRGALNESWALVFFPLIFWSGYKLVVTDKSQSKGFVLLLSLSYFGLLTSHNLMFMIFTPFFTLWILLHMWRENAWKKLPYLILSGFFALGLAAFFTFPALLENKFTQIKSQLIGYYEYTAHFVSIRQLLISRFWGYGPSVWVEAEDKMSFQIGHLHWVLSLMVGLMLLIRFLMKKGSFIDRLKSDSLLLVTGYPLLVGWFSAYMTHLKSIWIYQKISQLSYIQFPWRFLTLVIFAFSFIVGFLPGVVTRWKSKHGFMARFSVILPQMLVSFILVSTLVILSWNYFKPEHGKLGPLTDEEKFSGAAWELQQTAGIYDYLPIQAKTAPKGPKTVLAEIMDGEGSVTSEEQGTYWGKFNVSITSENSKVRINIFDFPNWRVFAKKSGEIGSGRELSVSVPEDEEWGRMWVEIPKGEYLIYAQLFNTPIRTISNIISLISLAGIILYYKINFKSLSR